MKKPPPMLVEKETLEYLHRIELMLDGGEEIGNDFGKLLLMGKSMEESCERREWSGEWRVESG